jgi:hypothetical protein
MTREEPPSPQAFHGPFPLGYECDRRGDTLGVESQGTHLAANRNGEPVDGDASTAWQIADRALTCLYIAVESSIADDVKRKVDAARAASAEAHRQEIEQWKTRASHLEDAAFHFQTCVTCAQDGEESCPSGKWFAAFLRGEDSR